MPSPKPWPRYHVSPLEARLRPDASTRRDMHTWAHTHATGTPTSTFWKDSLKVTQGRIHRRVRPGAQALALRHRSARRIGPERPAASHPEHLFSPHQQSVYCGLWCPENLDEDFRRIAATHRKTDLGVRAPLRLRAHWTALLSDGGQECPHWGFRTSGKGPCPPPGV